MFQKMFVVLLEEKHQLTFSKGTSNQYFNAHISSTSRAETKYLTLNGMLRSIFLKTYILLKAMQVLYSITANATALKKIIPSKIKQMY